MAHHPAPPSLSAADRRAPPEYWSEVESLGIHDLTKMADGPDFVGRMRDGEYIRVPNPPRHCERELQWALFSLTARCKKWSN